MKTKIFFSIIICFFAFPLFALAQTEAGKTEAPSITDCKKQCIELSKKGDLREGLTLEECAKILCEKEGGSSSKIPNEQKGVITDYQPSWLLLGGKDVSDSRGGDIMRVGGTLFLAGYELTSYDSSDPLTITFFSGGRIVYWKGKGEITKIGSGQKIVLPLAEK